ncbi:hypothetical protein A2634_01365 [Candidatus Amesbacteria bacterium RIFCSPHIGHO2_01_FULL_48_32]|uniref:Uncharacterized protein n=1 Tax=Candidatus Amesbacteria bacterium RIFCSPLOWO2_01_FULL_48_25 TaxID=1797259 RepID=A0A1F4ZBU6_9BACT|nr:MAG: hypothetical protein A2634_01365 [Candidatus Amesbacteria bacterium RIFCSPHIGHO2_01_FULL_48_32]OGD03691.1 MAG: hypothetical protein A2989_03350 [Candidatus Amesbacteria bacterium RIFCSPLOWO2_01_FULL_48_25]
MLEVGGEMDSANLYDRILGKEEFVRQLKEKGVSDEIITAEWEKIYKLFCLSYVMQVYDRLPMSLQKEAEMGLDITKAEGATEFLQRVSKHTKEFGGKMDVADLVKEAANEAYKMYVELEEKK